MYVSNPQLSITGSSDLRHGTSAVQLGHSANPASPDNGNFETFSTRGQLPCVLARSTPSARQGAAGGDEAMPLKSPRSEAKVVVGELGLEALAKAPRRRNG